MRWKIQLEGQKKGLNQLSESFEEDPRIFEENGEYYLWSSQFEQIDESGDVNDIGEDIVKIIRHLGELDGLRVTNLESSGVIEIQEDGSERKIVHVSASITGTATVSATATVDGEEPPPKAESTYEYTQLALKDAKVKEWIELRNNGDHWVNLYRIMEHIQDNIESENNTVEQGWWSESEKEQFRRTANSPEAIGHEARHAGNEGSSAPSEPMSHAEAKSLIDNLTNNWLKHRMDVLELSEDES